MDCRLISHPHPLRLCLRGSIPFVRKCLITGLSLGLNDRITLLPCSAHPINRDKDIIASNPLGKVPTLFTDDGQVLYDVSAKQPACLPD